MSAVILPWIAVAALASPARSLAVGPTDDLGSVSRLPVTCEGGRALTRVPTSNVPLLIGPCDGRGELGGEGIASAPPVVGPTDCLVPGYDDRCKAWTAPRYDGPWGGADYPGFGSVERNTTVLAHPSADLVFVGGTSTYGTGTALDADFVEIAYRASTGVPVWSATYAGSGDLRLAYQSSMALSPDGDTLYALGDVAEPGVYQYRTSVVAFESATGRRLWDKASFPFGINSIQTAITTLPDGSTQERLYAAGTGSATLGDGTKVPAGTAAAIDPANGDVVWSTKVPGATPDGSRFNELVVSPDGATVYAAGGEHRPDRLAMNFATVAFRATDGTKLWEVRDEMTQPLGFYGINGASDMAISPDGSRVLVTGLDPVSSGTIGIPSTSPILTVAHDTATGAAVWRKAYGGPVAGETHFYFSMFQGMMGLSPDGRTAVVTAAINSASGTGTVAYDVATGDQKWGVESAEPAHAYVFVNYIGFYPTVVVGNDRAFVSNRRGFGVSQYRTVTMAYSLGAGTLDWTGRLGTNRTLLGGSAISADRRRVFVTAADQLYSAGSPAPDAGLDSVDILTVAYEA